MLVSLTCSSLFRFRSYPSQYSNFPSFLTVGVLCVGWCVVRHGCAPGVWFFQYANSGKLMCVSNGCAYSTSGGDVYFDTLKFEELSGENYPRMSTATEQANPETSVSTGHTSFTLFPWFTVVSEKKRFQDFALWKSAKETDSVSWKSPWGSGRPGWHIECSAMIRLALARTVVCCKCLRAAPGRFSATN